MHQFIANNVLIVNNYEQAVLTGLIVEKGLLKHGEGEGASCTSFCVDKLRNPTTPDRASPPNGKEMVRKGAPVREFHVHIEAINRKDHDESLILGNLGYNFKYFNYVITKRSIFLEFGKRIETRYKMENILKRDFNHPWNYNSRNNIAYYPILNVSYANKAKLQLRNRFWFLSFLFKNNQSTETTLCDMLVDKHQS